MSEKPVQVLSCTVCFGGLLDYSTEFEKVLIIVWESISHVVEVLFFDSFSFLIEQERGSVLIRLIPVHFPFYLR